ncbi:response regulator [Candidatus Woesearchaeota archaeon]|nr:response regulator [Candidatus Woesearchaeota archaeon]
MAEKKEEQDIYRDLGSVVSEADARYSVLVIEDEPFVMDVTCEMLDKLARYDVLKAPTGNDALRIAYGHEGRIDLAMLDIGLPDTNAKKLYPQLKASRPDMKIIVCSGSSLEDALEIVRSGAEGFLQKPYSLNDLADMLAKHLGLTPSDQKKY